MKGLLVLLLLAGAGYLAYDDYSNRNALKQAEATIQQLQQQLQGRVSYVPRVRPTPARPGWFQKHLDQGTSLEQSRPHRHEDELGAATPYPTPH